MPGSFKTEAVVLRSIRFGEADRVLHLYTAGYGRVGAVAKGVRRVKSRLGGRLEPLSRVQLVMHQGRGELCTISQADTVHAHAGLREHRAALERGAPGIYNITDNEPAALHEWLPVYAEALGAKPPRRVPRWLARLVAGKFAAEMSTTLRGASNEKAKRELDWSPRYASWRQGFREALG